MTRWYSPPVPGWDYSEDEVYAIRHAGEPVTPQQVYARSQRAALNRRVDFLERDRDEFAVLAGEALEDLAVACDLLGAVTGKTGLQVLEAVELARSLAAQKQQNLHALERLGVAA